MTLQEFAGCLEYRIKDADCNYATIRCMCYDAERFGFASVQVFPNMLHLCTPVLKNSPVKVYALNSWSYNNFSGDQMAFEARDSVAHGADGVVAMVNVSEVKSALWEKISGEIAQVRSGIPDKAVLKLMLQTEYMTDEEIAAVCEIAAKNRVDYVLNSTGYYSMINEKRESVPIVTSPEDIAKIRRYVGPDVKIQAQGNIGSAAHALELLDAGADLIGSRRALKLYEEFLQTRA